MTKGYSEIAGRLSEFEKMAKLVFMSQMIAGIKDADMAFMVLMECEVTGQTLFQWAEENHIVGTRPTMKYDAMIAAYNQLPNCKFEFLEKSPERCAIALTDNGTRKEFSLTWESLKKEAVPYNGKEGEIVAALAAGTTPKLKDKYATPRSRAVMMYARLVSDAIRSTRPEVTKGRYTPEEVEDFDDTAVDAESVKPVKPAEPYKLTAPAPPAKEQPAKVEAAKAEPAKEQPAKTTEASTLEVKSEASEPAAKDESTNPLSGQATGESSISVDDPSTKDQYTAIIKLLSDLKRDGIDLFDRVKAKLASCKINGIAGMTFGEAESLRVSLEGKSLESWLEKILKGHSPS